MLADISVCGVSRSPAAVGKTAQNNYCITCKVIFIFWGSGIYVDIEYKRCDIELVHGSSTYSNTGISGGSLPSSESEECSKIAQEVALLSITKRLT